MKNGLIVDSKGNKEWYKDDQRHREDGPAIEYAHGSKYWYKEGKRHRLDGPAVEFVTGTKYWYYQGKHIECDSQQHFEKFIKLIAFW